MSRPLRLFLRTEHCPPGPATGSAAGPLPAWIPRGIRHYARRVGSARHRGFDHVTIAVEDLEKARHFFSLLGFEETKATVVSGEEMSRYMGIPDWVADHVTLELAGALTHQEVQILRFHHPKLPDNPSESNLDRLGFSHVCFAVDDLDGTLDRLRAGGVQVRNEVMAFHDRRLVFLVGPGRVTIELAEWVTPADG